MAGDEDESEHNKKYSMNQVGSLRAARNRPEDVDSRETETATSHGASGQNSCLCRQNSRLAPAVGEKNSIFAYPGWLAESDAEEDPLGMAHLFQLEAFYFFRRQLGPLIWSISSLGLAVCEPKANDRLGPKITSNTDWPYR